MAKKGKKNQQNYWDEDFEEDAPQGEQVEDTPATTPGEETPASAVPETGATEATEADFMSTLKKSKKKLDKKAVEEKAENTNGKPILKSKKEKEKEKKELEKQKKKEETARKKAQQQAQKDKNKELNKQNVEKLAAQKEAKESSPAEPADAKKPKKNAKKIPAGLAALKRQLELKKQLEEEERLAREEEERLEKEEQEKIERAEAELEEARNLRKEKEKVKREKLKAEGKLLSKKQKEEKKLLERRRAALLAAGNLTVAGLTKNTDGEEAEASKPRKVVYGKKKKKSTQDEPSKEFTPSAKEVRKEDGLNEGAEEVLIDDWENLAIDDDEEEQEENDSGAKEQPNESYEVEEEEEEEEGEEEEPTEQGISTIRQQDNKAESSNEKAVYATISLSTANQKDLRSPICCILGHVDTGKTKLLDKIRQTNVQGGEAGGITQQIGATYFPIDAIKSKTKTMAKYEKQTFDVPGLLVIDTPGHESFSNLRSRGSSLCNIAILVIDIMHGLEQQTLESIRLLRDRKAPFVVALNKIDRLYDWKSIPNNSFRDSFEQQQRAVKEEFESRLQGIKLALAEQGLNSELYFQNKNMSKYVSIVPTSAVTGEGVPDLLWLLLELTQKRMSKQLMYLSHVEATILEVKVVEGFGTTIDVILSNGYLREGDRIVLCGLNGPIVTSIRALLTPQPLRELRLKSDYVHHKEVKAALGVKIAANDLEKAVSGSRLLVVGPDDDEDEMMDDVMDDLTGLLDSVDTSGRGVVVQASTLGSLEALLDFLKDMKIPVMSIGLGPVYKRDVMKAGAMLEKAPEYAVMLCFDVKIDKEAEQYAEQENIKIFNADIIYHLFDSFTAYQEKLLEERRKDFLEYAIFPCALQTLQIINKRGPMIIGVDVIDGELRVGTPICAVRSDPTTKEKHIMLLGKVTSLEINHQPFPEVKKGQTSAGVAMRLDDPSGQQPIWGRHVDETDTLYSMISRRSIDTLKDKAFRDQVTRADWVLLKKLKPVFGIE